MYNIISENKLFAGLSKEDIDYALSFFSARSEEYKKGDMMHVAGEKLSAFGLVISGTVQVGTFDYDGNSIIMAVVTKGHSFGESLCFLGRESSVYIQALSDTKVIWLSADRVKKLSCDSRELMLKERFTSVLAAKTLEMNDRIQILSKIKLRDRLITYFSQNVAKYGNEFKLPLSREDMAVYLGTNRSALSRELGKMRDEGIIEFERNRFTVKGRMES
ncbi:MAG: Crp/Fnr family transcriptional regulator [Ruminococcaceae bacterium]|nr:Crp/Fnr family transcriptional regulator [Oscillospiraceae bacterium]